MNKHNIKKKKFKHMFKYPMDLESDCDGKLKLLSIKISEQST